MNAYQITVIVMLVAGLIGRYSRLATDLKDSTPGVAVGSTLLVSAITAVVPYCLYAGGFFK